VHEPQPRSLKGAGSRLKQLFRYMFSTLFSSSGT
jgi:hypothetical protein